ncbi:MAG: glutamate--tRNA ligase [Candidatus Levyibacteriota bacterium]|nr:MAG: glutamate--tRNA ligase [Candidatus Levybacteria bacterium]
MRQVRVRIAPSPTGIPHIGNTRTALFNYLFAKHHKGKFILRIEDTDRVRLVPGSENAIKEIFSWLGIHWDEEYKQSDRILIYKEYVQKLKEKELAYEDNGAVRFRMPKEGVNEWEDAIGSKKILFQNKDQEDFVILKSDGFPTYNFANVIDDHLMEITHVIRGDEFISSTPKHIQLYKAFGWDQPVFAHLPVILGPDHQKLSKRHGAKSALDYRDEGYLKEALLNYMVLLGWNPGSDQEIMSLDEMITLFDLPGVNTASPIFDVKKLLWMNGIYIRKSQISNLKSQIISQNSKLKNVDDALLDKLIPLAQTRMNTLNDFYTLTRHFFEEPKVVLDEKEKETAQKLYNAFLTMKLWDNETILSSLKNVIHKEGIRMPILYKILTGAPSGLPLPESLTILSREKTIKRLKKLLT